MREKMCESVMGDNQKKAKSQMKVRSKKRERKRVNTTTNGRQIE